MANESLALFLCGKRALTESAEFDGTLHGVFLRSAGVDDVERVAFEGDVDRELHCAPLDRAGQGRLAKLSAVMTCQLLAVLLQRHRRRAGSGGGFDLERPRTCHVDAAFP